MEKTNQSQKTIKDYSTKELDMVYKNLEEDNPLREEVYKEIESRCCDKKGEK